MSIRTDTSYTADIPATPIIISANDEGGGGSGSSSVPMVQRGTPFNNSTSSSSNGKLLFSIFVFLNFVTTVFNCALFTSIYNQIGRLCDVNVSNNISHVG